MAASNLEKLLRCCRFLFCPFLCCLCCCICFWPTIPFLLCCSWIACCLWCCCCCVCCIWNCVYFCICRTISFYLARKRKHRDRFFRFDDLILEEARLEDDDFVGDVRLENMIPFENIFLERIYGEDGPRPDELSRDYIGFHTEKRVLVRMLRTRNVTPVVDKFIDFVKAVSVFNHPNLLDFLGPVSERNRVGLVWEDVGPNIQYFLTIPSEEQNGRTDPKLPFPYRFRILSQVFTVLQYFHEKGIFYSDLCPRKIFLSVERRDFCKVFPPMNLFPPAPHANISWGMFQAPEFTLTSKKEPKNDIYSMGIIMFCVITNDFEPFKDHGEIGDNVARAVANNPDLRPNIEGRSISGIEEMKWYIDLMKRMWGSDPSSRPEIREILDIFGANSEAMFKKKEKKKEEEVEVEGEEEMEEIEVKKKHEEEEEKEVESSLESGKKIEEEVEGEEEEEEKTEENEDAVEEETEGEEEEEEEVESTLEAEKNTEEVVEGEEEEEGEGIEKLEEEEEVIEEEKKMEKENEVNGNEKIETKNQEEITEKQSVDEVTDNEEED